MLRQLCFNVTYNDTPYIICGLFKCYNDGSNVNKFSILVCLFNLQLLAFLAIWIDLGICCTCSNSRSGMCTSYDSVSDIT